MLWLLVALLQDPSAAPPAAPPPVTSLERIKRALQEPPAPFEGRASVGPVFRVTVRGSLMPDAPPWDAPLGHASYVQPPESGTHHEFLSTVTPDFFRSPTVYPVGVPVFSVVRWLAKGIKQEARKSAEAKARAQVQRELAELLARRAQATTAK
jgi:hypothetical protein